MMNFGCIVVLLLLAGPVAAQTPSSPSPSWSPSWSPSASPEASPSPGVPTPSPAAYSGEPPASSTPADATTPASTASPLPPAAALEPSPALTGSNDTAATDTPTGPELTDPSTEGSNTTTGPDSTSEPGKSDHGGKKDIPDSRVKELFITPEDAAKKIPELKELSKLLSKSPNISSVLKDKDFKATIFAPNNKAVNEALKYLDTKFPGADAQKLGELGVLDSLLQYHVCDGPRLTSKQLRDGMKFTMLDDEVTTIFLGANGTGLPADAVSTHIESNTGQKFAVQDGNYQGGSAIIHIIDGVLIPKSVAKQHKLTNIPGAPPGAGFSDSKQGAAPPTKNSASLAVSALLSVPALLAMFML